MRFLFLLCTICAVSCTKRESVDRPPKELSETIADRLETESNGLSKAKVVIKTDRGEIAYKLYPKKAPRTVARVVQLVEQGFYNGTVFHKVVPNFVIQGGDPTGKGTGGSGQLLKAEFNDVRHIKGVVAMARGRDEDSADSQFYIALSTLPELDRQFTVFGQVVNGFDVLDKIQKGDKMISVSIINE